MPSPNQIAEFTNELLASEETSNEQQSSNDDIQNKGGEETLQEEAEGQESVQGTEGEEVTQEEIEFFNELPDVLGLDPEQFYNLKLKTDNGQVLSWSEIKDRMQSFDRTQGDLVERQKKLEEAEIQLQNRTAAMTQQMGPVTENVQKAQQMVQGIEAAYTAQNAELQKAMTENRTDDMVKIQAEMMKLQGMYGTAQEQLNGAMQEQQYLQQQAFGQYREDQLAKLKAKQPIFTDTEKGKAAKDELKTYLLGEGISAQELSVLVDARVVSLFYKALQWDKHQKDLANTTSKVREKTVRRLVRSTHSSKPEKAEKLKDVIAKGKSSRREGDKRAAFMAVAQDAGLLDDVT